MEDDGNDGHGLVGFARLLRFHASNDYESLLHVL